MNDKIQSGIKTVIFSIFSIIIAFIIIRFFLKLTGANPYNEFAQFWYSLTDIFVSPFEDIYPNIVIGRMIFETYSLIALLFYIIISLVLSKSATSPFEDTRKQAIIEIVDSLFKIAEFLLISRFIFKLTGASINAPFVKFIYNFSSIVYDPFSNILPAVIIDFMVFEFSTLLAVIIIVILDLVTEQFLVSLLQILPEQPKHPQKIRHKIQKQMPRRVKPQAQNITINIPQQPPNTTYIDKRSVNVVPMHKSQSKPQRKGFLQFPKKRSSRQGGPASR